jgi:hypothetical protein
MQISRVYGTIDQKTPLPTIDDGGRGLRGRFRSFEKSAFYMVGARSCEVIKFILRKFHRYDIKL